MREKNRKPIANNRKRLLQFTTMNVIDGQAGLIICSSLIFYSLTIDNILNIIVLLILAGVAIATLTGENGILRQAERAKEATENAEAEEKQDLADLENLMNNLAISEDGYDSVAGVNKPRLSSGMIPVKWNGSTWVKADENNTDYDWYQYGTTTETKKWANVVTVKANGTKTRTEYESAAVGTEINMEDITTMFVWIPRYAYKIVNGYQTPNTEAPSATNSNSDKKIEVTFLKGNTNIGSDGEEYEKDGDTNIEKIVHPGFTIGSSELTGIWVAKFEASGLDSNGNAVGNASATSNTVVQADSSTYVRILPSQISWRHVTTGESEYQSMQMSADEGNNYGWSSVNSHLIKNSEWGAVAYLCYSLYGNVPMTNGSMSINTSSWYYNMYTGAGPNSNSNEDWYGLNSSGTVIRGGEFTEEEHGYSTANGILSSTTGNIYGIYDMAGGAWERVAGYLDNGNSYLGTYGKSTSNSNVIYFANNSETNRIELDSKYNVYWDSYEVGEEEYNNAIVVEGVGTFNQGEGTNGLWKASLYDTAYNVARNRITGETYKKMANHKGIGVSEVSNTYSYYGSNNGKWTWMKAVDNTAGYAVAWNNDYVLIGHSCQPFVGRGGFAYNGAGAGVLDSGIADTSIYSGFRPVLAF